MEINNNGYFKILTSIIFCVFSLINYQEEKMEEKYQWLTIPCIPQEYPKEIYDDALIANDFTYGFDSLHLK